MIPLTEKDRALMAEVLHRGLRHLVPADAGPVVRFTPLEPSDPRPALGARRIGPENVRGVADPFRGRKAAGDEQRAAALEAARRESEERCRAERRAAQIERNQARRHQRAEENRARIKKRQAAKDAKAKADAARAERVAARRAVLGEARASGARCVKIRATGLVLSVEGPKPRKPGDRFCARLIDGGPLTRFVYTPSIHEVAS